MYLSRSARFLTCLLLGGAFAFQLPLLSVDRDGDIITQSLSNDVSASSDLNEGTGHLSEWSRSTKQAFLKDLENDAGKDWIMIMGNEAGDLDSMVSALAYSFYLTHLDPPTKAIALLQTDEDALFLRPENTLALAYARMAPQHKDLLTIDELPIRPWALSKRIKGIVLVDHARPRAMWSDSKVLSIFDHHKDVGVAPDARPRVFEISASCSSLVTREIMANRHKMKSLKEGFPAELAELLMRTIAIDSDGLKNARQVDHDSASELYALSSWRGVKSFERVMDDLDGELSTSKKNLTALNLRDLLRRDWKDDAVSTSCSNHYHAINVGFASIPMSLEDQIDRTPEQTPPEFFAIERAWTSESGSDVSIILSSYKDKHGNKVREITLVVATGWGGRIHKKAANGLFKQIKDAIESSPELKKLEPWKRPDGKPLLPRRAVWRHYGKNAGRKVVRPIVEKAIREWQRCG